MVSRERLLEEAEITGFQPYVLEKVFLLLSLLSEINRHPDLAGQFALKGGTALNLFQYNIPRLSLDIDLNFIGAADLETLKEMRPALEKAIAAICNELGLTLKALPQDHAGGKWVLSYRSSFGRPDRIELDLNFLYRVPLWPVVVKDSRQIGSFFAKEIPIVSPYELAAGKLKALMSRKASRDLFDANLLLQDGNYDYETLRLALVIFGAMNPKDWRTVDPSSVGFLPDELNAKLIPVLNREQSTKVKADLCAWAEALVKECQSNLSKFFPLTEAESEFIKLLREDGKIDPSLITADTGLQEKISAHPALLWRASKATKPE